MTASQLDSLHNAIVASDCRLTLALAANEYRRTLELGDLIRRECERSIRRAARVSTHS